MADVDSSNIVYIDNNGFDEQIDDLGTTADCLEVDIESYDSYLSDANGTTTIEYISDKISLMNVVANYYKCFLDTDITTALTAAQQNINNACTTAAENIKGDN